MGTEETHVPEVNFSSLIITLSSTAWVSLGKITDPISGEMKKDLKGAKFTIDTLIMLREKTKGNLTQDEEQILNTLISELQANYAETVFAGEKEKEPSEEAEKPSSTDEKVTQKEEPEKDKEEKK